MAIDLKLLETYRAVMEQQSMTGAAKVLGLTQPAVSAQIARLEAEVGFELFDRSSGRLRASERGCRFENAVLDALGTFDRLAQVADSIRTGDTDPIVVASHPSASISIMPSVVNTLIEQYPTARVRMINRTSEGVRAYFDAGGADIAIAELPQLPVPGAELRTFEIECVAILPPSHPLAGRSVIECEDLRGEPFIGMMDNRLIGRKVREMFGEAGIDFDPIAEVEFFSAICGLVAAGAGISIVDRCSAQTYAASGIAIRRFNPAMTYEIGMFSRRRPVPHAATLHLADLIEAYLGTVASSAMNPAENGDTT